MFKFTELMDNKAGKEVLHEITCQKGCIHKGEIDLFSCAHCKLGNDIVIMECKECNVDYNAKHGARMGID